jgi:arginyl-tRNA synthetase
MINLKRALARDIEAGLLAAQEAGDIASLPDRIVVNVDRPEKEGLGDYACPSALQLAKTVDKQPMEIVELIAKHMPKK